jgi:hypothetical protein
MGDLTTVPFNELAPTIADWLERSSTAILLERRFATLTLLRIS